MWNLIARFLSRPAVRSWLIRRAARTPFSHIVDSDGNVYMKRYWLFNRKWKHKWLPAIRIHYICIPDDDRALHDHPFDFRSVILQGHYTDIDISGLPTHHPEGSTYFARAEKFHRITDVSPGGVFTMVICYGKSQPWGFLAWITDMERMESYVQHPVKIHHRDYDSGMKLDRSEENKGV